LAQVSKALLALTSVWKKGFVQGEESIIHERAADGSDYPLSASGALERESRPRRRRW
jgi:hypothetical protein